MKIRDKQKQELLSRAQKGDMDAFAELFEEYRSFVFSIAYRLTGNNDSEDIVMESFLKAWHALPRFQKRSSLKTWLARITRNCALDFCRNSQKRKNREVQAVTENGESYLEQLPSATTDNPAGQAVDRETAQIIDSAMAQLSREQRTTVIMREVDGLSYREIAAATEVNVGTVMSRLFYAKRKLQRLLREVNDEK